MLCTTSSEIRSPSGRASQLGEAICVAAATIPARSTYRRRAALGREWEAIEGEIGVGNSQRACAHYKTTFSRCIGSAAFVANTMVNAIRYFGVWNTPSRMMRTTVSRVVASAKDWRNPSTAA